MSQTPHNFYYKAPDIVFTILIGTDAQTKVEGKFMTELLGVPTSRF